jgi:hypothetical protein
VHRHRQGNNEQSAYLYFENDKLTIIQDSDEEETMAILLTIWGVLVGFFDVMTVVASRSKGIAMRAVLGFVGFAMIAYGCSYSVQPASTRAINIYSAYENKVPGNYVLVLDGSIRNVNREVAPASHVCSAHRYPISVGDSLAISIKQTLESVFERVNEQTSAPSGDQLNKLGYDGVILVRLDDFSPRVLCTKGFASGTCTANTDISFGVTVRGTKGVLATTGVSGSKTTDGDAGGTCGGGATVIGESITRATRDAMERMAERLSNSPKLREANTVVATSAHERPAVLTNTGLAQLYLIKGPVVSTPPQAFSAEFLPGGKAQAILSNRRPLTGNFELLPLSESIKVKFKPALVNPDVLKPPAGADVNGFAALSDGSGTQLECVYSLNNATGRGEGTCEDNQRNTYRLVFD